MVRWFTTYELCAKVSHVVAFVRGDDERAASKIAVDESDCIGTARLNHAGEWLVEDEGLTAQRQCAHERHFPAHTATALPYGSLRGICADNLIQVQRLSMARSSAGSPLTSRTLSQALSCVRRRSSWKTRETLRFGIVAVPEVGARKPLDKIQQRGLALAARRHKAVALACKRRSG